MDYKCSQCPWLTIWVNPRETIRRILSKGCSCGLLSVSAVYGFNMMMVLITSMGGMSMSFWMSILTSLVLALPVGYALINLNAFLIYIAGKVIRGRATFSEVRAAVTWSTSTVVINVIAWVIGILVFGPSIFGIAGGTIVADSGVMSVVGSILSLAVTVASIWGFVLLVITVSEVQRYSNWLSLLNIVIAIIAIMIIMQVIGWVLMRSGLVY